MSGQTPVSTVVAVVPAAGAGVRLGAPVSKPYVELCGRSILERTLVSLSAAPSISGIVLVAAPDELENARAAVPSGVPLLGLVPGGEERFDSVLCGLNALPDGTDLVLVHDGVRPFVTVREIEETVALARGMGAAIAATSPVETVKETDGERIVTTRDRGNVRLAQTPQVFRVELLQRAYRHAMECGTKGTDESSLVERLGADIGIVEADRWNIKITREEDILLGEWILREIRK